MNTEKKYMIIRDRVEIYHDFSYNLLHYIYKYYLDKETLNDDKDIKNHFMFCYNKTCDDFLNENIDFKKNDGLIQYFYMYYYHQFYKSDKENIPITYFIKFWKEIFNVDKLRNKKSLNLLVEIYTIFDISITNMTEKNILEII